MVMLILRSDSRNFSVYFVFRGIFMYLSEYTIGTSAFISQSECDIAPFQTFTAMENLDTEN